MNVLDKARALKCFGKLVENIELDPDPNAQDELTDEYNCANCDTRAYCREIALTLEKK